MKKRDTFIAVAALCALLSLQLLAAAQQPHDFDLAMSSYLGDSADSEAITGIAIQSTGFIVIAANLGPNVKAAKDAALLNGATATSPGCILILSEDGKSVLLAARVGTATFDLAIDGQDRIWVALGPQGAISLSPDAKIVRATVPPITNSAGLRAWTHRVDVGRAGTVALLASNIQANAASTPSVDVSPGAGTLIVLNADAQEISRFDAGHGSDRNALDVVVDDDLQMIIIVGWKQAFDWFISGSLGGPVQIPWIRAVTYQGQWMWVGYDWGTNPRDPNRYLNEIGVANRTVDEFGNVTVNLKPDAVSNNNMADGRLYRAVRGEDGNLYVTGHSAGGNHLYRYAPMNNLESVSSRLANYDFFTSYAGARDQHLGFIGRYSYNRTFIRMDAGQGVVARLNAIEPNTLHAEGGGIAADLNSRIYLGGISAYGLPFWPNEIWKPQPDEQSFNPFGYNDYTGGAFMLAFKFNSTVDRITGRAYCGRIAFGKTKAVAVRTFNGVPRIVWGGYADLNDGAIYTTSNALQTSPGYGVRDAWFAINWRGKSAVVAEEGESVTAILDQGPLRVNTTSTYAEVFIRNSRPIRVNNIELDGDPSTPDARVHYPWSQSDPLTPESDASTGRVTWTYSGAKLYGGLTVDIGNLNESVRNHTVNTHTWTRSGTNLRLTFNDGVDSNQKILMRGAIFAYTNALFPGTLSTDRYSFDAKSIVSFTFERFVVWNSAFTILMQKHLRFIVREGPSDWFISEKKLYWQGAGPAQWAPHILTFSGPEDGRWAKWTTQADGLKFDPDAADFINVNFQNIQAIGFWITDDDWYELPWTKPVPGSDPPVYLEPSQQVTSAGSHLRLAEFTVTVRKNAPVNRLPFATFSMNTTVIRAGDSILVDASSSSDPDGYISFVTWSFGDGSESSGITETKTYVAAGLYYITVTVYDNTRQISKATRRLTVLPATVDRSQLSSVAAGWWGQALRPNGNRNMIGDKNALSTQIDLTNRGSAQDHQIYLQYAGIERPLTTSSWLGTRLIGGWRFDTRNATGSFLNDWLTFSSATNNNPSLAPLWDVNGVRAGSFGAGYRRIGTGARMDLLFAIDKVDFLGGADQATVTFDASSRLSCGPFWLIGGNAELIRFAVRDGSQWFISQAVYVSPGPRANNFANNGYGNASATPPLEPNPSLMLSNPGLANWAPWDPLSSQLRVPTSGFAVQRFSNITAFGATISIPDWLDLNNVSMSGTRPVGLEMRAKFDTASLSPPVARLRASINQGVAPLPVAFDAIDSSSGAAIREYRWDSNDGVVAVTRTPEFSHQYVLPGFYNATLTIVDVLDRTATSSALITVTDAAGLVGSDISFGGEQNPYVDEKSTLELIVRRMGGSAESSCSVGVKFVFDTATQPDVVSASTRVSWGPKDTQDKIVRISFAMSDGTEPLEHFQVVLADPFGGIRIGSPSVKDVYLGDEDGSGRAAYDGLFGAGQQNQQGSTAGAIAGGIIGALVGVGILVAAGVLIAKKTAFGQKLVSKLKK